MSSQAPADHAARSVVENWIKAHQGVLFIDNTFVPARSGSMFAVVNPATGQVLGSAAEGLAEDVDAAVRSSVEAFENGPWSRMSAQERAHHLRRFAGAVAGARDELVELGTLENGMTLDMSRIQIDNAVENLLYFAGTAVTVAGRTLPSAPSNLFQTLREPIGVCAAITAWNGPVVGTTWKIGPALASGNTIILKPAEQTPFSALRMAELAVEAGLPPGVLNVVTGNGPGAGSALVEHPGVGKITFTGSTAVGKKILTGSVDTLKRVTLELGGKSPNIVWSDADLDLAVPASVGAFTSLTGQMCSAWSRVFVHEDIHEEFTQRLAAAVGEVRWGDPTDPATTIGPLISADQHERVGSYLAAGKEEGATAIVGGELVEGDGYFVQPTVFTGVTNDMRIAREEIFGPVLSVISFRNEDEVVAEANDTEYGLGAAIWTRDLSRAHRLSRRIRAGSIWINQVGNINDVMMPFGGYRQSGLGRELGLDWYHAYTEEKAVLIRL